MAEAIMIDTGVTHPDLFDGETPIRVMADIEDVNIYAVTVSYIIPESVNVMVAANNEENAITLAIEKAETIADVDANDFDVASIEHKANVTPSEAQVNNLRALIERQQQTGQTP